MKVIGVIPARWGSTRFEGKVLADINGKPMIRHVWERAQKSRKIDEVLIACDDERIMAAAKKFNAQAVMTSKNHPSGTDRIAEAVKNVKADIVINIQADEPLIDPATIDALAACLSKDKTAPVATVIKAIEDLNEIANPNVVKVAVDHKGYALYFSRSPIPYNRAGSDPKKVPYYKHAGIYAYRKNFLLKFKDLPKSKLESAEKLEQLRILEAGYKIKTVLTRQESVGVDTPEDLARVKELLNRK